MPRSLASAASCCTWASTTHSCSTTSSCASTSRAASSRCRSAKLRPSSFRWCARISKDCVMTENFAALAAVTEALQNTKPALPGRLTLSSAQFVADFKPPDYLIVGWLQRRFVYSLTAATGDGKTAVALLIALLVSHGLALGKLKVKRGRVLYFAGEK